jgi:hypothetical protein
MQLDQTKFDNLVLYICSKAQPSCLGAVKLHKVLYYSDMLFFAQHGTPITGAAYRKRPFGPTCDSLLPALRSLEKRDALEIRTVDFFGYAKKEYHARRQADPGRLSEREKGVVDAVIDFVCNENSAKTISELSHNRAWDLAEFGEPLPYVSVFQIFPTQVSPEAMEWGEKQVGEIAAERSRSNPLDYVSFASFRSRVLQTGRAS